MNNSVIGKIVKITGAKILAKVSNLSDVEKVRVKGFAMNYRYINTNAEESKLGSYYIDKISREGRKYGLGMIISSQVPSMLDYEIVSQCNSVIMHKITSKRDLEFLRNVIRVSSDTFYLRMSALEKQHAIVCGEAFPNDTIVRIHAASPLPKSNDPVIEDRILGI